MGGGQPALREALIRGYVYLCQFVPDPEAEVLLATGLPDEADFDLATNAQAVTIINRIKLDMERALEEIRHVGLPP